MSVFAARLLRFAADPEAFGGHILTQGLARVISESELGCESPELAFKRFRERDGSAAESTDSGSDSDSTDSSSTSGGSSRAPSAGWESRYALSKLMPAGLQNKRGCRAQLFEAPVVLDELVRSSFGQSKGYPLLLLHTVDQDKKPDSQKTAAILVKGLESSVVRGIHGAALVQHELVAALGGPKASRIAGALLHYGRLDGAPDDQFTSRPAVPLLRHG